MRLFLSIIFSLVLITQGFATEMVLGRIPSSDAQEVSHLPYMRSLLFFAFVFGFASLKWGVKNTHPFLMHFIIISALAGSLVLGLPPISDRLSMPDFSNFDMWSVGIASLLIFAVGDVVRASLFNEENQENKQFSILYYSFVSAVTLCLLFLAFIVPDVAGHLLMGLWVIMMGGAVLLVAHSIVAKKEKHDIVSFGLLPSVIGFFLAISVGGYLDSTGNTVRMIGWGCCYLGLLGSLYEIYKFQFNSQNTPYIRRDENIPDSAQKIQVKQPISFIFDEYQEHFQITEEMAGFLGITSRKRYFILDELTPFIMKETQGLFKKQMEHPSKQQNIPIFFHGHEKGYLLYPRQLSQYQTEFLLQESAEVIPENRTDFMKLIVDELELLPNVGSVHILMLYIHNYELILSEFSRDYAQKLILEAQQKIAKKLSHCPNLIISMTGSQEISIFYYSNEGNSAFENHKNILRDEMKLPITGHDDSQAFFIDVSIGGVCYNYQHLPSETELNTAIKQAQNSLREQKKYHTPLMSDMLILPDKAKLSVLLTDLRYAPEKNQIEPYFRPRFHLQTGKIAGFDVLATWLHPDFGLIMPELLLPLSSYIAYESVIQRIIQVKSIERLSHWSEKNPNIFLNFQVTKSLLQGKYSLYEDFLGLQAKIPYKPKQIHLTFHPECLKNESEWLKMILCDFKMKSFITALDDFGAIEGYLPQLATLPFDRITLSASFYSLLKQNERKAYTLKSLSKILTDLNLVIDMKDIVHKQDIGFFKNIQVQTISGALFSPPISSGNVSAFLQKEQMIV